MQCSAGKCVPGLFATHSSSGAGNKIQWPGRALMYDGFFRRGHPSMKTRTLGPFVPGRGLLTALVTFASASLIHHVHNAVFLNAYPDMPGWITTAGVYAAWALVASVGVVGYYLLQRGYAIAGLLVIAAYGATGFDGLGHYSLAPMSAHSTGMNITIWFEVLSGATLLLLVAVNLRDRNLLARLHR
jgi:hypothetical protein